MSGEFDPYHRWLSIPPKDQPPDHYRLLGVERFESDADVIDAAANKQMAYVRSCATGPHMDLSQKILNELAAARVCLLNAEKKAAYDQKLRGELAPPELQEADVLPEVPPPRLPVAVPVSGSPSPPGSPAPLPTISTHGRAASSARWPKAGVYAIVAVTVTVAVLLVAVLSGPGDKEVVTHHAAQTQGGEDAGDERAGDLEAQETKGKRRAEEGAREAELEKGTAEDAAQEAESEKRAAEEAAQKAESEKMDPEASEGTDAEVAAGEADAEKAETESIAAEAMPDQDEPLQLPDDWQPQLDNGMADAETPADFKALTEQALHFADLAVLADNAHAAEHSLRAAVAAARKANDIALVQQAALRYARLQDEGLSDRLKEEAAGRLGTRPLGASTAVDGTPLLAIAPFDAEEARHQQPHKQGDRR